MFPVTFVQRRVGGSWNEQARSVTQSVQSVSPGYQWHLVKGMWSRASLLATGSEEIVQCGNVAMGSIAGQDSQEDKGVCFCFQSASVSEPRLGGVEGG